jgi:hypothetical protein
MKSKDFAAILHSFANLLRVAQADITRDRVLLLAAMFEIAPAASVADVAKRLTVADLVIAADRPTGNELAAILTELRAFLTGQVKPPLVADIAIVEDLLLHYGSGSIARLVEGATTVLVKPVKLKKVPPPVRRDLIDHFARELEIALGDEAGFVSLFNQISNNDDVGKPEAAEIAKRFTGKTGASKPAALKKIWARHHNLMTFRAKSESRAGRSGA